MINVKDANGNWVVVKSSDFMEAIQKNTVTLFGMDLDVIMELRAEYMERGGPMPMNVSNIRGIYAVTKRSHDKREFRQIRTGPAAVKES